MSASLLVSIGMFVHNEESHIAESIESLLDQTHKNIELIISDNASTDRTGEICRSYQEKDARIKYIRNKENIGSIANLNKAFKNASAKYLMLASGHDLWSTNFISKCLKTLTSVPQAVVSFGPIVWINQDGKKIEKHSPFNDTSGMDAVSSFNSVFWGNNTNAIYGLIKIEALRGTRLGLRIIGLDHIVLAELSLMGTFAHACGATWYRRQTRVKETAKERIERYSKELFKETKKRSGFISHLRLSFELFRSVLRAKISVTAKCEILFSAITAFPVKYLASRKPK